MKTMTTKEFTPKATCHAISPLAWPNFFLYQGSVLFISALAAAAAFDMMTPSTLCSYRAVVRGSHST